MHTVTGPCRYLYTEQPPTDLNCNPYPVNALRLSCAVTYSDRELPVTLKWIYRPNSNTQTPMTITESDKYKINPSVTSGRIRSTLEIKTLTNTDAGSYSCQAEFTNGSRTGESQRLNLFTESVFTNLRYPECVRFSESTTEQKCAGQVSSNTVTTTVTTTATTTTSSGGGAGGGGAEGAVLEPALIAVVVIAILLVITASTIVCCCILCKGCKHL